MFVALATVGGETPISNPSSKTSLNTHVRGGWVGHRDGEDTRVSKKTSKLGQPGTWFQSSVPEGVTFVVTIEMQ
jgi:hypothetical protein